MDISLTPRILVIERGQELHHALTEYARTHNLAGAWISGIGGANAATIGYYNLADQQYEFKEFTEDLEITSLSGNLSWVDGAPFWHIHGVFSGSDFKAVSGHVKELHIGLTCELLVTPLSQKRTRIFDETTGLKLLSSGLDLDTSISNA